jgi:UDP-N-acetylmuramyl tripeptide synthase
MVIPHREHAIHLAATLAKPWDVVLLAGIWHQDVLDTNFGYIPWSEKGMIEKAYETLK